VALGVTLRPALTLSLFIAESRNHPEDRPLTLSNWRFNRGIACMAICLCLVLSLAACATRTASRTEPVPRLAAPQPPVGATPKAGAKSSKTVSTSYQGSDTAGQPTASGKPYNPEDLTAASRNLPMGSTVKVTNPDTGRSVKVRINDRGPFVHGRSLDLSKRAAEKIGITDKGVARVKVTPVNSHPPVHESPSPVGTPTTSPGNTLRNPPTP
jgi:rare lipoprotein A